MDALDQRLVEIANQCKTESELVRLQALLVQINVWRSEAGNTSITDTSFTYEQFIADLFGQLTTDIFRNRKTSLDNARDHVKAMIEDMAKSRSW